MAYAVIMPKAGMAMERGTIIRWLKAEGDAVAVGEPLLEIETDKVAMEVEAEAAGVLLRITRGEGEEVPVTETIGYIGAAGETVPQDDEARGTPSVSPKRPASPPPAVSSDTAAQDARAEVPEGRADGRKRVPATPVARRLAEAHGIRLDRIRPSGARGQVMKRDVLAAVEASAPGGTATAGPDSPGFDPSAARGRREPLTAMRRAIADAMGRSALVPQFTLHADALVDRLNAFRADVERDLGVRPGITTCVVKALALALQKMPAIAAFLDGCELLHPELHGIGVAVSVPGGIVVQVIRDATAVSLLDLDAQVRRLAERARAGQLAAAELTGAVTTVSNLGAYGVSRFTPMITPPQSSVLGVSAVRGVPAVVDGVLAERRQLGLDLTVDHRVTDGAEAATFLQQVVRMLQDPLRLVV